MREERCEMKDVTLRKVQDDIEIGGIHTLSICFQNYVIAKTPMDAK